jgi:hypothetical protein
MCLCLGLVRIVLFHKIPQLLFLVTEKKNLILWVLRDNLQKLVYARGQMLNLPKKKQ